MTDLPKEWRRGWQTVFSGFAGVVFMTAVPTVTGLVMAPLMAQFGWSRTVITANVLICSIFSLALAPILGSLIARFGVRRCALVAITAAAPALCLIALAGGSPLTWIAAWTLFAIVNVGISPLVWTSAVAASFDRARGMALAVTLSGSGLAYFLFPPLAVAVLERFDWRAVYLTIAAMMVVLLLPVVYALFCRSRADEASSQRSTAGREPVVADGFTLQEALRSRQFWQFITVAALMALAEGALQVHLFPILQEGGLAAASAAWAASLMGIAMIAGRILAGFMQDRLPPLPVFGFSILVVLLSCVLLRFFTGQVQLAVAASVCLGLGTGGTTIGLANLTSRYFGLLAYPSIYGLLMGGFSLGYGVAPVVAGHLRETTTSYLPIFDWLAVALVTAAILAVLLGKPRHAAPARTVGAKLSSSTARR